MRVLLQLLIPGMEYGENADASTEAVSISGDLHQGLGDSTKLEPQHTYGVAEIGPRLKSRTPAAHQVRVVQPDATLRLTKTGFD